MHQSLLDHLHLSKRPTSVLAAVLQQHRSEVDSHADTCAFGSHVYTVQDTGAYVNVDGFTTTLGTVKKVAICTMAVAYDCPYTLSTYILFFHQALYIKGMTTNLISPFQLRVFGVTVKDTPLQHLSEDERSTNQHCIHVGELFIPLDLKGTMSGFPSRKPTLSEVQDTSGACGIHIHVTSEAAWDPHSLHHNEIESTLRDTLPQDHPHFLLSPLQVRGLSEVAVRFAIDQVPY